MIQIKKSFRGVKDKAEFVSECESEFNRRLDDVCTRLTADPELKIIALSGPTCSGKTTTAKRLISELEKAGHEVHLISIDDFFKDRDIINRESEISSNTKLDYDSVNAIDLDYLRVCSENILRGDPTLLPRYDFTAGKRSEYAEVDPEDNGIFIFEGIQAIYPEVTALFGSKHSAVYISVAEDLEINGVFFTSRDLRLMRRLVRDFKFRGAEPEFTLFLWRSVLENEERSINPFEKNVDIRISSLMPYEVFLLKDELLAILERVSETGRFFPKAYQIIEKLRELDSIPASLIPEDSLMHEFIG